MDWYQILMLIGIPSIISTLMTALIISFVQNKRKTRTQEETDNALTKQGLQALLRNELLQSGEKFVKNGYVDVANKQNYDNMYSIYHRLGKNGVMAKLYERVMNLPTSREERKEPVTIE